MSQARRTVLIIGGTGTVGGEALDMLKGDSTLIVKAGYRKQEQEQILRSKGVTPVLLDLNHPESIQAALQGVNSILMVLPYSIDMIKQGCNVIDAAKQAGVTHIVSMSSLCKPGGPSITNVGLWRWHTLIQAYAEASGVGWTHLRCGFFMENLIGSVSPDRSAFRSLCGGSPLKQGWIAGRDIGAAAAEVLRHPDQHKNSVYYLAGPGVSPSDISQIIAEELKLSKAPKCVRIDLNDTSNPFASKLDQAFKDSLTALATLCDAGVLNDLDEPTAFASLQKLLAPSGRKPTDLKNFIHEQASKIINNASN